MARNVSYLCKHFDMCHCVMSSAAFNDHITILQTINSTRLNFISENYIVTGRGVCIELLNCREQLEVCCLSPHECTELHSYLCTN